VSVYVDHVRGYAVKGRAKRWGTRWSHMFAGSLDELHEMALTLGLRRSYFQPAREGRPWSAHYDITPPKRKLAVIRGASEITARSWVLRHRRGHGELVGSEAQVVRSTATGELDNGA